VSTIAFDVRPSKPENPDRANLASIDTLKLQQDLASRKLYLGIKRTLDLAIVLAAAMPVLLVIGGVALAILVSMGRPIFFMQPRVGRGGRVFTMLKLRTMVPNGDAHAKATDKADARVTPLGRFLRCSHLDELPQLWNILTGDMTLIGPRPEQPALVARYSELIPHYDLRHAVTPGLSGWSQVCYGYAATDHETTEKLTYDLHYVQNIGPVMDAKIAARTVRVYMNPSFVR
jgi:lipopolysaccharide/colanic/teichoic acid biosynthesis glycosyltransferase